MFLEFYQNGLPNNIIAISDLADPLEKYQCIYFQPYTFSDSEDE